MSPGVFIWLADPSLSRTEAMRMLGCPASEVVDMVDVTHSSVHRIPSNFPKVAGYTTGTPDIQWTADDWTRWSPRTRVIRIDQSATFSLSGNVGDTELGAKTVPEAVAGCMQHVRRGLSPTAYLTGSELQPFLTELQRAGGRSRGIVAVQWAWPTTNPNTFIPGTRITLSEANADLSVTRPDWFPLPKPHHNRPPMPKPKPPHPKIVAGTISGAGATALAAALNHLHGIHLTPAETGALVTFLFALGGYLKAG